MTSTFTLCGECGTLRGRRGTTCTHTITHAVGDMGRHVWHWAGSVGALGSHVPRWSPRLFAWQAWHLETSTFISRGKRGTYVTGLVAHSVLSGRRGRHGFLRGRRGTCRHVAALCVAGVALCDIHIHFVWQVWHLAWQAWHNLHTYNYSRRRGSWRHGSSLCVASVARMALGWLCWRARFPRAPVVSAAFCLAGVALGDIHLRFTWQACYFETSTFNFTWQAWHVWHWAGSGGALGSQRSPWSPRLFAWQAWHVSTCSCALRGRRGT